MADPYSGVTITGYNSNPPVDDGSQTEANRVKWATIKTKITDPVKDRTDNMDTALIAAFGKIDGGVTSTAISYTVISTDQGKLVRATAAGITITTPDATDVDAPFVFAFLNDSTGDVTLDGSGSQTVDGDASVTVPAGTGFRVRTDGSNWYTEGQNFQRTLVQPQGYLTVISTATAPTSPIPTSDQAAVTAVYYRPFRGNLIPIPDGTTFAVREFSELTLTLNSNHVASGIYDCFVFSDAGTLRLVTGPVWTNVTAGSCARGSGAGTTELDLLKGLLVNKVAMTGRNGATTYSVGAASAIFVGSIFIDSSAGQTTLHVTYGTGRKWGVSNAYNREQVVIKSGDPTNYSYTTNTWRAARGGSNTQITIFDCLPRSFVDLSYASFTSTSTTTNQTAGGAVGIGYNSTTAPSGYTGTKFDTNSTASAIVFGGQVIGYHQAPPALGIQTISALENGLGVTGTQQWSGGAAAQVLTAKMMA